MKRAVLTISAILSVAGLFAQNNPGNVLDLKHSITDPSIVYPESFETDIQKLQESWFIKNYTATDNRYSQLGDVNVSDEVIINRLSKIPNVIEMPFNQVVRSYIDKYTKGERGQVPALLGLGLYYNPIFEQALEEHGLPLELKYLPMIESSLDPNAVSKHGAAGLWQFMLNTAKGLGMEVNSLVDERRDPYLSSEMAANYLKGLYETYGDWSLAIAAYNCGPGTLNKAIRRAGGDPKDHDFWSIYNYLPPETRGYVPAFIAINYVMTYYPEHNFSPVLPTAPLVIDTIHLKDRIHFEQISQVLDIPVEELRILNPQYRADIIPGTPEIPRNLILPSQQIHAYLLSEEDIKNYEADKYAQRETVQPAEAQPEDAMAMVEDTEIWVEPVKPAKNKSQSGSQTIVHKVKAGETLSAIAKTYEVSIDDIKKTNNLKRDAVRVGQQLRIVTNSPQAVMETTVATVTGKNNSASNSSSTKSSGKNTASSTQKSGSATTHTIKKGETLSTIASKYGVTIAAIKNANGMKNDKIQAGQKIKIPAKSSGTSAKKSTGTKSKRR
ncbi:MAG: LysM peptidoglycan-binding domain-containing protein [Muribaculaceae bacterium]|nr:LysM peptidoglycan-binding domain-containing protein [Muribaculaceae bacterium]